MSTSDYSLSRREMMRGAMAFGTAAVVGGGLELLTPTRVLAQAPVKKVYIDPGHGGSDPGAVGNGLQEKNVTLTLGLLTRDILQANWEVNVRMSRTSDITRSLSFRSSDANSWGADAFVSIHINAGGGTGFESFRHTNPLPASVQLQDKMHSNVLSAMRSVASVTNRGKKSANFHVLRETNMPAVLTENLFIDTVSDANLLKRSDFRAAVARGHAEGIAAHLGLPEKETFSQTVASTSSRFTASGNWGTSSWNSQKFGSSYRFATPNTTSSDPAWYKVNIPSSGSYKVDVWYPADPGYNSSTPYMVQTTSGLHEVRVNQQSNGGGWRNIGTFNIAGGDHNVVGVSRWTGAAGYVIADAVRVRT